jgi:hypothetical protein
MKKMIAVSVFAAFMLGAVNNASAFWGSNNDWECMGPFGEIPGCNPYDEWDPRYWMEEMEDMWDDDDYYGGGYGRGPYGGGYGGPYGGAPYGGGYGGNPYGGNPYGGGYYPQPYYGGGYMQQPYAPYPAPPAAAPPAAPAQ